MRRSAPSLLLAALATCTLLNMAAATNTVPKLNQPAPEFSGTALVNGAFKDISKADYAGKWVVLFFYPMDFTFVCPTEICAFNDRLDEFHAIGAEVIGVSVDSHFTHLAWTQKSRKEGGLGPMDLTLLADKSHAVTKAYGVQVEDGPDAGVSYRGLFIIDPSGNLRQITVNDLPVGRSVDETLRLVQAFQFVEEHGEVCPANWKPGKATIKPDASASLEFFGAGHTEAAAGAEAKKARTD